MIILKKTGGHAAVTLAAQVYELLRDRIIEGKIPPGTNLVRRKLSKEFGVSPIPVTEALWRLEQDGLVEYEPMNGSRVRQISVESIKDELVLREAIECQVARLCTELATKAQLDHLRKLARKVDDLEHAGNLQHITGVRQHMEFHLTVAKYSASRVLEMELQRVGYRELMRLKWITAGHIPSPPKWHAELVEALATRDPAKAEAKMRAHVRFGTDGLWQALQTLGPLLSR